MAGTKIPNFCVMSDTVTIAREIEKQSEGMRILISQASKQLLDKVGGFRCDPRGTLELPVRTVICISNLSYDPFFVNMLNLVLSD